MANYTKRKDGRYQARIYLGLDENGKKIFKYIYSTNVKDLKIQEAKIRQQHSKGIDVLALSDTFKMWAERLFKIKEAELTDSELELLKFRCGFFIERIGNIPLKDVHQTCLQEAIMELFVRNPTTGKQTSKRTLQRYISAASAVFEYAIENRVCDFNPCKYVKVPKNAETTERRALTPDERKWIEETPHRAQPAAMLLMYSGLRRGEATALLWTDVDLDKNTISVTKSFDFKEYEIKPPKTASSYRVVSIPQVLSDYLRRLKRNSIYVLTTANGKMMTNSSWQKMWESYMCDLNLKYGNHTVLKNKYNPFGNVMTIEPFTPHCLRHTFCTIMYEAGIDVLTAKEQMGHSDVRTTLAIYTHLDKVYKTKNIEKMDEYLQGETSQKYDKKISIS